jgi:hypothetical protein
MEKTNSIRIDAKTQWRLTKLSASWWKMQKYRDGKPTEDVRYFASEKTCIRYANK